MVEFPEIEMWNIVPEFRQDAGKAYEKQAEKPTKSGEEVNLRHAGVSEGEVCKSCMDIPEGQRRTMILEIQQVVEELLKAHGVIKELNDLLKGEWFLKLQKPGLKKTGFCKIWRRDFCRFLYILRMISPFLIQILFSSHRTGSGIRRG